jgi:dTDP-4-dehydrorhamnose 3,5-epimerase
VNLTAEAQSLFHVQRYDADRTIDGVEIVELKRFNDDGGSMVELLRLDGPSSGFDGFELRQVNYSCMQPDVIKAFHVHRRQTDLWFVRPEDRLLLVLVDVREGSPAAERQLRVILGDGNAMLVRIPPGVAHGCRNLGSRPASLIYFTDRHFQREPESCDEGRLPWDFVGEEVWNVARE